MGKPRGKIKRYSINPKLYNRKEVEELKDKDYEIEQRIKMLEYQMEKLKEIIHFWNKMGIDNWFIVGFAGGGFLTEIVTKSFPKFGSIIIGLLFGLIYMELNKERSHKN